MRIKYLQSLHRNFPNKLFCTKILQLMLQIKPSFRTPFTMVISSFFFFGDYSLAAAQTEKEASLPDMWLEN